jgi:hypothetical protein
LELIDDAHSQATLYYEIVINPVVIGVSGTAGDARHLLQRANLVPGVPTEIRMTVTDADPIVEIGIRLIRDLQLFGSLPKIDITGTWEAFPITLAAGHPTEVAQFAVDQIEDLSIDITIDAATFAVAKTNTPLVNVGADIGGAAQSLNTLLAGLGFNGRINFVYSEGPSGILLKAYAAETTFTWPASIRVLTEFSDLVIATGSQSELANSFVALYKLIAGTSQQLSTAYLNTFTVNKDFNEITGRVSASSITQSVQRVGNRSSLPIPFPMLSDEASVIEVFAYYINESLRGPVDRFSCMVPYWLGYDLEAGDIVAIRPVWETSNLKCRVVAVAFDFDLNGVGLNLEQVP